MRQELLAEELAGEGGGTPRGVERGRELHVVHGDYVEPREDVHHRGKKLAEPEPARLLRPRAGELRWVEDVHVDRKVDGRPLREGQRVKRLGSEWLGDDMARLHEVKLVLRAGAYSELPYPAVAEDVVAAAHDACVGEAHAKVVLTQVGVRVEVDYPQVGMAFRGGADGAERDKMLAAEQERRLPGVEDLRRLRLDHVERAVRRAERQLQVPGVVYKRVRLQVPVLVRRVRLDSEGLRAHGGRPKARPGPEAGG